MHDTLGLYLFVLTLLRLVPQVETILKLYLVITRKMSMTEQELMEMDKQELVDILSDLNPDQEDLWDYSKSDLIAMILELV